MRLDGSRLVVVALVVSQGMYLVSRTHRQHGQD